MNRIEFNRLCAAGHQKVKDAYNKRMERLKQYRICEFYIESGCVVFVWGRFARVYPKLIESGHRKILPTYGLSVSWDLFEKWVEKGFVSESSERAFMPHGTQFYQGYKYCA